MNDKCEICNKNEASLLCDMPIDSMVRTRGSNLGLEELTLACDKKICHECAIEIHKGIHFCKECIDDLKVKLSKTTDPVADKLQEILEKENERFK